MMPPDMFPTEFQGSLEFQRTLVLVLDLCGTFAFAVSGGTAAVRRRLDLFGVLVVSFAASTFGGISRDVLIGDTPPAAFEDWRYLAVAMAAGVIAFYWSALIERLRHPVRMLDAVGLAFFAVAGTQKALAYGLGPVMAALMGMLTGIGGGMARDILLADVPAVLRSELYAVAALAGAGIMVAVHLMGLPVLATAIVAGLLCFGLRMAALRWGWQLPVPRSPQSSPDDPPR